MSVALTGQEIRKDIRTGGFTDNTAGQAPGFVQANLAIVPQEYAFDFLLFCQRNPKPCPLLEVIEAGEVSPRRLAPDADIRTDLPRYRVWVDGELTEEPADVTHVWRDDMVSFLLGCSFSFEKQLLDAGLNLPHIANGTNVSMYRTNIACRSSGPFAGPMVVSMRSFLPEEALKATLITGKFPLVHGAPVHQGNPAAIGIGDIGRPDYGDVTPFEEGEIPVFWACGVTPQAVLLNARIPFAITHSPGHMFVSDIREEQLIWFGESVRDE